MTAVAALCVVFFLVLLLPSLSPHYGFYSDELYYLACADRPALGYVDQPPLFVWLLALHRALFGDSLLALRALPAALGAVTAFLTAWMARRLGGGTYAQLLAAFAFMVGQSLVMFSFFSVNCLAILLWTAATALFLELCRSRDPRLWLALGAVLALAFLTKHTIGVLVAGLAVATLVTPLRRDLPGRWPWLGALLFAGIAAPNVYWQLANDWPSLAFYRSKAVDSITIPAFEVVIQQVFVQNPATLPIWVAGVVFFLRSARYRAIGGVFLTVFALALVGGQSIPYRISGAYQVLFAGGAVLLAAARRPDAGVLRRAWNTWTLPAFMLLAGVVAASIALPILPPEVMRDHPLWDGDDGWRVRVGEKRLPYHLGNRTHWPALVADVEQVVAGLDPDERSDAIVLADYFGHAGALEYHGSDALPPVYSPHTGYYLWGPPEPPPHTVISIGVDEALLRAHFAEITTPRVFRCRWCPGWQDELPIRVATDPRRPFADLWRELGARGGMDRQRRLVRALGAERS